MCLSFMGEGGEETTARQQKPKRTYESRVEGWEWYGESGMDAGNGGELGNGNGNVECQGGGDVDGEWTNEERGSVDERGMRTGDGD